MATISEIEDFLNNVEIFAVYLLSLTVCTNNYIGN